MLFRINHLTRTVNSWFAAAHFRTANSWIVLLALGVVNLALYFPALLAHFISDDFQYLSFMLFNSSKLLDGQLWDVWLLGGIDGYLYFRPLGHVLMLSDFWMWGITAWGYHLTNLLLHWLVSFEVYLLSYALSRHRGSAFWSAVLFTLMPVHSEAVSWIAARYDVIAALFCLMSLLFFISATRHSSIRFLVISIGAFALALSSKETAVPFPILLFLYDLLFNTHRLRIPLYIIKYHVGYWIIMVMRLVFFGHGYQGLSVTPERIEYWFDGTLAKLVIPFPDVILPDLRWLLVLAILLVCFIFYSRRCILFGIAWIFLMSLATLTSGPSDRSFYLPSVGLALALGDLFAGGIYSQNRTLKGIALIALLSTIGGYGTDLYVRNQDIYRASQIAEAIPAQVKRLYPTLPNGSRLVFVGVPEYTSRGTIVYITGFSNAIQIAYHDPSLAVLTAKKFPLWLDALDKTFYFHVDHRKVTERADLIQVLRERAFCEKHSILLHTWDYAAIATDWELWNQLGGLEHGEGAVTIYSEGRDPIMASPFIDIPSLAIGEIQVTMRVHAAQPILSGEWYWLASGQSDFSPALRVTFPVFADGEWHTYRANIAQSGMLLMDDNITRIRFDPVNVPAEIAIRSILVFTRCNSVQGRQCICPAQ